MTSLETVTLVFTDLVGSTELANRIGPGPADDLRREHFGLLRKAAATGSGREVKNLGDGLMFAFSSVSGALDAAVSMQRAIVARNRAAEHRFEIRVGIALGEVTAEDDDYFGEPVIQAARLCALATGGEILAADLVRVMAAATTKHSFRSVGGLDLKGLPSPVEACAVTWSPEVGAAAPLPPRLRGAPEVPYVGRQGTRAVLERAWKLADTGKGSLVLLEGEPGIGKTRLAAHIAMQVHDIGGTVLYGAVDEGLAVPYQPWIEALRHYVDHAPEALLEHYVAQCGPDLARLVPALARRVRDLPIHVSTDGESDRYILLEVVTDLLRIAATDNPVLIVIDDLQWADAPTLSLLIHVHRTLADSGVLILGTFRDTDLSPGDRLSEALIALRREERVERISLGGLDESEISELLSKTSGQQATIDTLALARSLGQDTNGNPLFVGEVLRDMLERGQLAPDDKGVWGLVTPVAELRAPATVRDVVGQRVRRLGADAQTLLATAAVIGRDFELEILVAVLGESSETILQTIESAMAASLLTETAGGIGSFRFIHALIAQSLADELSATRRAQLNLKIADAIEELHSQDLGDRTGALARHLVEAGSFADRRRTVRAAHRAGVRAQEALAPDEALRWFDEAISRLGDSPEEDLIRGELMIVVGEAQRDAGVPDFKAALVSGAQRALAHGKPELVARAARATHRIFPSSVGTTDAALVAVMEGALELTPERTVTRALLLAQLGAELLYSAPLDTRRRLLDEACDIARSVDDTATLLHALVCWLGGTRVMALHDERQRVLDELRGLLVVAPTPQLSFLADLHELWISLEAANRSTFDGAVERLTEMWATSPHPTPRWTATWARSLAAIVTGDLQTSEALATEAFQIGAEAVLADTFLAYGGQLMGVRVWQGRLAELLDLADQSVANNPGTAPAFTAVAALARIYAGRADEARGLLDAMLVMGVGQIPQDSLYATAILLWCEVSNRVHHTAAAAALQAAFTGCERLLVTSGVNCAWHVSTALGQLAATLGNIAEASEHFESADAQLIDFGADLVLAKNRYEYARALVEAGDPALIERALTLARSAADLYSSCDSPGLTTQCEDLLALGAGT